MDSVVVIKKHFPDESRVVGVIQHKTSTVVDPEEMLRLFIQQQGMRNGLKAMLSFVIVDLAYAGAHWGQFVGWD